MTSAPGCKFNQNYTLVIYLSDRFQMETTEALLDAIAFVQPTVFFGPPRAYEM
jgi:long-subunit acyl-CoA synthetase (AMP-forming)